jgi:8-oxo-dGTP pyrophosphatase MutT (NUDIX family)
VAAGRFRACIAVYGVLAGGGRILLMRRAGSGYRDGQLGLPAGHLEGHEDAVTGLRRELREELAISVPPEQCVLGTVLHRPRESEDDDEYVDLFFTVGGWTGTPSVAEPGKCSELVWADPDQLPPDTVDYVAAGLRALRAGQPLLTFGWDR